MASATSFMTSYRDELQERAAQTLPPLPLNAYQTVEIVRLLQDPLDDASGRELLDLLTHRVPPGVDEAAYVKAGFLAAVARRDTTSAQVEPARAVELLGTMQGGYNVGPLVDLLDDAALGPNAAAQLKTTILMFDAFYDVEAKARAGNLHAADVLRSWADAEWFARRPAVPDKLTVTVFKVPGETNTDDLSPAPDAWSRPDIPLHARSMLVNARDGIHDCIAQLDNARAKGWPLAYVGDVVGTGSSRKSATNSILWHMGEDIPHVPNKRTGGVCLGGKIAPIFFNTLQDSGALPIECDVSRLRMDDVIDVYPHWGEVRRHETDELVAEFQVKTPVLFDEVRAGGRIPLIIGRGLTDRARTSLGLEASTAFCAPQAPAPKGGARFGGFTLAQKMVGRACGVPGVRPGTYCEPKMTSVGSQDTTGPMTRDELKDLACLGFSADLVMQSFCHTAAYPKPVDVVTHQTLPDFIRTRGGISLRPGDGIIHSWLNRMLLPDTVGTGGDSHTRFPIGISFPAGSGLVAFAAATGVMPLDMPESVRVRFKGEMQPGITLRDLVHAIPYYAIQAGALTVEKRGKRNVFSGRILEIEGLDHLTCEQAFELSDASAERSAAGCTIRLDEASVAAYLRSNVALLRWMVAQGYGDARSLERRVDAMRAWLEAPTLLEADPDATYTANLEIDVGEITEPIVCCPNDPDDAQLLSAHAGMPVDEVFVGSCMTNIGHFRAAGELLSDVDDPLPTRLWVAPPTKMDEARLRAEGYYEIFERVGARLETPGCSLCMGNQARVEDRATVVSTSTRNFPNRLGKGANVYLASAELAAVTALLGRLPTPAEYLDTYDAISDGENRERTYQYLQFDEVTEILK